MSTKHDVLLTVDYIGGKHCRFELQSTGRYGAEIIGICAMLNKAIETVGDKDPASKAVLKTALDEISQHFRTEQLTPN